VAHGRKPDGTPDKVRGEDETKLLGREGYIKLLAAFMVVLKLP